MDEKSTNENFSVSLQHWRKHVVREEGYYFAKNLQVYEIGIFLFAFMSKWQLKVKIFNIRILPKILYMQKTRVILSTYNIGFKRREQNHFSGFNT